MEFTQPSDIIDQLDIVPGMKAADLGAGSGHYTVALAKAVQASGVVFAVEVQREVLERLKKDLLDLHGLHNVECIWGDLEHVKGTKIADQSIDIAVLSNTLFQVEDRVGVLREIKRICKPTAEVLFVEWSDSHGGLGPVPEHIITPDVAQFLFTDSGFIFFKTVTTGAHHYGQIYKLVTY